MAMLPTNPTIFEYNNYVTQKSITGGILDVALLIQNIQTLQTVVREWGKPNGTAFPVAVVIFVSVSLILQVVMGAILGILTFVAVDGGPRHNEDADAKQKREKNKKWVETLNDVNLYLAFFLSVSSAFIVGFTQTNGGYTQYWVDPTIDSDY